MDHKTEENLAERGAEKIGALALVVAAIALLVWSSPVLAQWQTQSIALHPGWNAVRLDVDPEPADPSTLFAGVTVESVWMWNPDFSTTQFIQDPETVVPEQPEWLHWFPATSEKAVLNSLFALRGGSAYLIRLGGSAAVDWRVTGRPVLRPQRWAPDSYNLVGFAVDPSNSPTLAQYLAPSSALSGGPMFRLSSAGVWEVVTTPATERIQPGVAYWVYCKGSSPYPGPLKVVTEGAAVDFGEILTEQALRIENFSTAARQVQLRLRPSASPPSGMPANAGAVALSYWDGSANVLGYVPLTGSVTLTIGSGKSGTLRLAVRREAMNGGGAGVFQSLLEISDGAGTLLNAPVAARGLTALGGGVAGARAACAATPIRKGLWVGTARINAVNHPNQGSTPKPTDSEMQIRLIVHVDECGVARLLQQVTLLWKDGTTKPDPTDPLIRIPDEPGRFVLITRDNLLSQYSGAVSSSGQAVGQRISSAAFAFSEPQLLEGVFGVAGSTLGSGANTPITLAYDDPLNPFVHKYHPDHDNLDRRFETPLPNRKESYTITRSISLTFSADDPEHLRIPGWGDTEVGGSYSETIQGIHRDDLKVAGTFRLHHASPVTVLNDGQ